MCLNEVKKIYNPPLYEKRIGYKIVRERGKLFYETQYQHLVISKKDMEVDDYDVPIVGDVLYPSGFHIFRNLSDAEAIFTAITPFRETFCLIKVEYTKIVAEGIEIHYIISRGINRDMVVNVDVAKEMKVLKEIKRKGDDV